MIQKNFFQAITTHWSSAPIKGHKYGTRKIVKLVNGKGFIIDQNLNKAGKIIKQQKHKSVKNLRRKSRKSTRSNRR